MGFFANFFKAAVNEIVNTVEGTGEGARVGRRQRAQRWYERNGGGSSPVVGSIDDVSGVCTCVCRAVAIVYFFSVGCLHSSRP